MQDFHWREGGGGGGRTHITSAKPQVRYDQGPGPARARLKALEAVGGFDGLSCYLSLFFFFLLSDTKWEKKKRALDLCRRNFGL